MWGYFEMFDLVEEGVSKREYLGLGESYKTRACVCVWWEAGTRVVESGDFQGGGMWLEGRGSFNQRSWAAEQHVHRSRPGRAWGV